MMIRKEEPSDIPAIRALLTSAFGSAPHSSGAEAAIVDGLREGGALTISLIAEDEGEVVGHVAFSPVKINAATVDWYGLGPVTVHRDKQRRGVGRALIEAGLDCIRAIGGRGCVVLGDPAYYGRFGFKRDPALRLAHPPAEYFQQLSFGDEKRRGVVEYHPAFFASSNRDTQGVSIGMTNRFHEANRRRWDAGSASWARRADTRGTWEKCHLDPSLALHAAELKWLNDIAGKNVVVLGSGDNQVVFAMAGLGASVTSVDISEQQIEVARNRAAALCLNVRFVQADVVDLSSLGDATFDVVYTGGYVAPWVSDLRRYYGETGRILKPGGLLIVSEYHPFRRVWRRSASDLKVCINYFDRGPHRFEAATDVLYHAPGPLEQFEFHWTVADYISAILDAGCRLVRVEEFGDGCEEWEGAPMAGLPETLLIIGRRKA